MDGLVLDPFVKKKKQFFLSPLYSENGMINHIVCTYGSICNMTFSMFNGYTHMIASIVDYCSINIISLDCFVRQVFQQHKKKILYFHFYCSPGVVAIIYNVE